MRTKCVRMLCVCTFVFDSCYVTSTKTHMLKLLLGLCECWWCCKVCTLERLVCRRVRVQMFVRVYVHLHVCTRSRLCVHVYKIAGMCMGVCVYTYSCLFVYVSICLCAHFLLFVWYVFAMCVCMRLCVYVYVCMCMCFYRDLCNSHAYNIHVYTIANGYKHTCSYTRKYSTYTHASTTHAHTRVNAHSQKTLKRINTHTHTRIHANEHAFTHIHSLRLCTSQSIGALSSSSASNFTQNWATAPTSPIQPLYAHIHKQHGKST